MINEVLEFLPRELADEIIIFIEKNKEIERFIEEIRIRINQNLTLKIGQELVMIGHKVNKEDIKESFENICEKSIYAYIRQISEGFITIKGGNRVGLTRKLCGRKWKCNKYKSYIKLKF